MATEEQERTSGRSIKATTVVRILGHIYRQVLSAVAGCAILAFAGNFIDFRLSEWLATLMDVWDRYLRPPPRWLLHYVFEVPASWFGWDVELPQWLRDYLTVGMVIALSMIRSELPLNGLRRTVKAQLRPIQFGWDVLVISWVPFVIIFWPISAILFLVT